MELATPSDWPFEDAPNTAVFTARQILRQGLPVLLVTHDVDEGDWQFLPGCDVTAEDAMIVALAEMIKRDQSLAELADLPEGWWAHRERVGDPWIRAQNDEHADDE